MVVTMHVSGGIPLLSAIAAGFDDRRSRFKAVRLIHTRGLLAPTTRREGGQKRLSIEKADAVETGRGVAPRRNKFNVRPPASSDAE